MKVIQVVLLMLSVGFQRSIYLFTKPNATADTSSTWDIQDKFCAIQPVNTWECWTVVDSNNSTLNVSCAAHSKKKLRNWKPL